MTPEHKRYLLLEQGIGSFIVNFLLNGAIAYLMFRGATSVPLWGDQSIAGDTIATAFILPLATCLIVTRLARQQVTAGRFAPVPGKPLGMRWMPSSPLWRGALLGAACALAFAPVTIALLSALGVSQQSFGGFVVFKAIFAAALGGLVTPLIALWAIAGDEALRAAPARAD